MHLLVGFEEERECKPDMLFVKSGALIRRLRERGQHLGRCYLPARDLGEVGGFGNGKVDSAWKSDNEADEGHLSPYNPEEQAEDGCSRSPAGYFQGAELGSGWESDAKSL